MNSLRALRARWSASTVTVRLVVFNLLLFGPFMGFRVLRTAGDDKVYVAQALEMARDGHWFMQTLADRPDYYKGPLHFILIRIGILLFGHTMWATLYMNLALTALASVALGKAMQRLYPAGASPEPEGHEQRDRWAIWAGGAFACSIGVYLHAYASQMETELACAFSISLYLLSRASEKRFELLFWIAAGVTGWLKSPLHAVFVGVAGLLYWAFTGELWPRAKRASSWGFLGIGTLVGVAGYLPALFLDGPVFVQTYLLRETFHKGPSGEPWFSPVWPILTFFLFPWMLIAFVAYADGLFRLIFQAPFGKEKALGPGGRRLVLLGFVFLLPSMLFFAWFPYRMQSYVLPAAGAWLLAVGAIWASASRRWLWFYRGAVVLTGLAFGAWALGFAVIHNHFRAMPPGCSELLIPFLVIGSLLASGLWIQQGLGRTFSAERLLLACLPFYLGFGALNAALGEREMRDLRQYIAEKPSCEGKPLKIGYFNLQANVWNEWGYLNFMVPYPVDGLHTEAALRAAIQSSTLIVMAEQSSLDWTIALAAKDYPTLEPVTRPWKRWRTRGRAPDGSTLWKAAWDQKDLSVLEAQYWMLRFKPKGRPAAPGCE